MSKLKIIECPRDAMQGIKDFIPTEQKIAYLNSLLKVGFHSLDFGSFVSAKAIPQMADTKALMPHLEVDSSSTKLLAIVANVRGAEEAASFKDISYLGFPFSVSETFQQRNTNSSIANALLQVEQMLEICNSASKDLVVYLSMGFGNPYGDAWSVEIVAHWAKELADRGVKTLSLADTVGSAQAAEVKTLLAHLQQQFPLVEIGAHLHSTALDRQAKIQALKDSGCMRIDGALKGFGGCPMATDSLTGNMATELLVEAFKARPEVEALNHTALQESLMIANDLFSRYH